MKRGIIGTLSDEMRQSVSNNSSYNWDSTQINSDENFPLSLKKLKNKPFLTDADMYMIQNRMCHGKGKRKRKNSKKKKK